MEVYFLALLKQQLEKLAAEQGDDGYLDARIKFLKHQVYTHYTMSHCNYDLLHEKIESTREDQNQQREKETKLNNINFYNNIII